MIGGQLSVMSSVVIWFVTKLLNLQLSVTIDDVYSHTQLWLELFYPIPWLNLTSFILWFSLRSSSCWSYLIKSYSLDQFNYF